MSATPTMSRPVTCPQCGAPVTLPAYADLAECPFCGSSLERVAAEGGAAVPPHAAPGTALGVGLGAPAAPGATVEAAPPGEQVLHSLSCPRCAGPLSVRAGRRILLCGHCGVRVLNTGDDGVSHWLFPQAVDRTRALSLAARWLSDHPGIARAAREAPLASAQLVHIPIWEHKALVAGWEFGTKLRTNTYLVKGDDGMERLELTVEEEAFQDPHLQERRYFQAACDLTALGAARPRFSGRELLLPLIAGEVDPSSTVYEPQGAAGDVAEKGRTIALRPFSGAADPHTWMLVLRESVSLLYYPLWLVDYRAGGAVHRIVVDAREGAVNSATAPAANARTSPALLAQVGGLVVAAVLSIWVASFWTFGRVPTILLAAIFVIAALLLVFRSPSAGKVEYHEPFSS